MNKKTVIVLGYKKLGKILNDRLALLSNINDIGLVILTGTKVETLYMKNYIDNVLKLQLKVIIDNNSHNTFQNIKNVQKLIIDENKKIVVTSHFHKKRVVRIMKSLRFDAQVIVSKNEDPLAVKMTETFYNIIDIIWNMFR